MKKSNSRTESVSLDLRASRKSGRPRALLALNPPPPVTPRQCQTLPCAKLTKMRHPTSRPYAPSALALLA